MTFELLEVNKEIISTLEKDGIKNPTKIQKLTIPAIKQGKDVVGVSNTGSGKTVAFGVPIIEKVVPGAGLQTLILTPTRELTVQIAKELKKFSRNINCNITTVYGGVAIEPQIHKIPRSEIVVGTTGRLIDHLRRGTLDLSKIKMIVLDEADKMVEMGFIEDIELILSKVPKNKQVLLFGATISNEINDIKKRHMNDPVIAQAESYVTEDFLKQYYYDVKPFEKFSLLAHLLKTEETERVIIFCSTRANVEVLTRNLKANGVEAEMIHGKLRQNTRQRIMDNFNRGRPKILVASAVAARGIDIKNVSHIFNYSLSKDPEEYIHRVGRTARAGESGKAITLLEPRDHDAFGQILHQYSLNVKKLEKGEFPSLRFVAGTYSPRRGNFHSRGRRPYNNRNSSRSRFEGRPSRFGPRRFRRSNESGNRSHRSAAF